MRVMGSTHLPLETNWLMLRRYTLADAPAIHHAKLYRGRSRYLPFGPMMSGEDAINPAGALLPAPHTRRQMPARLDPDDLPLDLKVCRMPPAGVPERALWAWSLIETSDGSCELDYTVDPRLLVGALPPDNGAVVDPGMPPLGLGRLTATVDDCAT